VRFLALILGLLAGIFALATPIAFKTDLMTPFVEYWASAADARLPATLFWSALPVAALLGGILCVVMPGFAALLLLGAGLGWAAIALTQPALMDFKLLVPAGLALLGAVLAQVAGELDIHRRRRRRREMRATAEDGADEVEREAAFRVDPTISPRPTYRQEAPPPEPAPSRPHSVPPRRAVPLKFENGPAATTPMETPQAVYTRQETIEPATPRRNGGFRWDDDDAPTRAPEPEPAREMPRPSPRFEQRQPDHVAFVSRPGQRRAEVQPELRSEPRGEIRTAVQQPYRRPVPQRRNDSLAVPIFLGIGAVLLLTVLAGIYIAHREGYLGRIVAALQSPAPEPAQQPAASSATTTAAAAPQPAPVTAPAAVTVPTPAPSPTASAPATPTPALPEVLPAAPDAVATAGTTYDDPFAYCTAVGTIDFVDARYSGPAVIPEATQLLRTPADAPRDRVHWRCADGVVMACSSYAGPICDRAPTVEEMQAYCERNPTARPLFAPHGIWSCVDGKPQLPPDANWPVDDRGFMPRAWVAIRPAASGSG
jgi:hypothetical protein